MIKNCIFICQIIRTVFYCAFYGFQDTFRPNLKRDFRRLILHTCYIRYSTIDFILFCFCFCIFFTNSTIKTLHDFCAIKSFTDANFHFISSIPTVRLFLFRSAHFFAPLTNGNKYGTIIIS